MKEKLKPFLGDVIAVVAFLLLTFVMFHEPISQGMVLGGHDSTASIGSGQEQTRYAETHNGETTRWTNSMFSGMPTYQISPSYSATRFLNDVAKVYELGTTEVLCYIFVLLLGFYIMLRAFGFKWWTSGLGALAWAFSSYFFIIIAAGHIWKVMTLAFIPPTIGGLVLCYRGKLLWGAAVTALFTAFQIMSNHVQMSYYFFFVMLFIVLAYGIAALRSRGYKLTIEDLPQLCPNISPKQWLKATGVVIIAGLLGVAANIPNLYHTYDYSRHTMRGGSELTTKPAAAQAADSKEKEANAKGLDYDYITQWSYGIGETLTLLIPDFNGGGSGQAITDENAYDEPQQNLLQYASPAQEAIAKYQQQHPDSQAQLPGANQYWGDQPFTVGPVYVGAFFCFLFFLGLFIVRGPMKWAMAAATVLSLLFAWGHNSPWLTHFFIDHLPMYDKFRTVSSALVIAEFTIPLLGVLALATVLRNRAVLSNRDGKIGLATATVLTAGVCLVLWIFPSAAGSCLSNSEQEGMKIVAGAFDAQFAANYTAAIAAIRHSVLSASAGISLLVILVCGAALFAYSRVKSMPAWVVVAVIALVSTIDLYHINKRYLSTDNFTDPVARLDQFQPTQADKGILKDPSPDYRVLSYAVGDPFNENTTSYLHKNVGGYHPAKLQRYQDLIEWHLQPERIDLMNALRANGGNIAALNLDSLTPVLNMLNTKYYIISANDYIENPAAAGNGWFVKSLNFVKNADEEMAGLGRINPKQAAVADEKFRAALDGTPLGDGEVKITKYEPNELHYDVTSAKGGLVVFSEVYYPGWTATVDGKPAEIGRVDYVLRAIKMPAGSHKVVMEFRPTTVTATNAVAYGAIILVLLLFVAALVIGIRKGTNNKGAETKANAGA